MHVHINETTISVIDTHVQLPISNTGESICVYIYAYATVYTVITVTPSNIIASKHIISSFVQNFFQYQKY